MLKLFRVNTSVSLSPPCTYCAFAAKNEVLQVNAQLLKKEVFKIATAIHDRPRLANCTGTLQKNQKLKRPRLFKLITARRKCNLSLNCSEEPPASQVNVLHLPFSDVANPTTQ
jgi:biotin synthase-like enzyme